MKQHLRRQRIEKQSYDFFPEPISLSILLSEEELKKADETETNSSENRVTKIASSVLYKAFAETTHNFAIQHKLKITIVKKAEEIPEIPTSTSFKYSYCKSGSLNSCAHRIERNEDITVVLVSEDDLLIGYGIAISKQHGTDVEIIDVDCYSRREAGFSCSFKFEDQEFTIGVGHIVVNSLMKICAKPISVDSTNRDPKTIEMHTDLYMPFGQEEAEWKGELLRFHDSQHQRNLRTRGHGFDERILAVNREIARDLALAHEYAEAFEVELYNHRCNESQQLNPCN